MFITFEGIDGSGKTTQLEALRVALEALGVPVLVTRDPGGTPIGQALRQILLHHTDPISPRCELFLYLADRAQHVDEKIRPALAQGTVVLCDRYVDSTVAYQGGGRGLDVAMIEALNQQATEGLMPHLTLWFDGEVTTLLARAKQRSAADRFEQLEVEFYQRVRHQYQALAQHHPDRMKVIDATLPPDSVLQQVLTYVMPLIKPMVEPLAPAVSSK